MYSATVTSYHSGSVRGWSLIPLLAQWALPLNGSDSWDLDFTPIVFVSTVILKTKDHWAVRNLNRVPPDTHWPKPNAFVAPPWARAFFRRLDVAMHE